VVIKERRIYRVITVREDNRAAISDGVIIYGGILQEGPTEGRLWKVDNRRIKERGIIERRYYRQQIIEEGIM
jgi:hypothetical protein